jgi:hypothetical protein
MAGGGFTAIAVNTGNSLGTGSWEPKEGLAIVRYEVEWAVVRSVHLLLPSLGPCAPRPCGGVPSAPGASPGPEVVCAHVEQVVAFQQACELDCVTVELPAATVRIVSFGSTPATASCRVIPLSGGTESVVLVSFAYAVTVVVQLSDGTTVTVTQPVQRRLAFCCPGRLEGSCEASVTVEILAFEGPFSP